MTMTFNKGGATEFARAFFRLAEGTKVKKTTIFQFISFPYSR